MANAITIHGRSSFQAEVSFADSDGSPVDISTKTVFFETKNAAFRKQLTPSVINAKGLTLHLTVAEVDQLPTSSTGTPFIIRDETIAGSETVLGEGTVQRTGWTVPA